MFAKLWAWIVTAYNAVIAPVLTAAAKTAPDPLLAYIEAQNYAIGPMPGTGGIIHRIAPAVATQVVADIRKGAGGDLTAALATAWIQCESRFDPQAIDPNDQDATPGETPAQAAQHADIGIGQFDMSTLEAMPEFVGQSVAAIEAKAEDPDWGVAAFCTFASGLLAAAKASCKADPTILNLVPDRDYRVVGIQAYNSGPTGALAMARSGGGFAYAMKVLQTMDDVEMVL
jgi:hypothetical protein